MKRLIAILALVLIALPASTQRMTIIGGSAASAPLVLDQAISGVLVTSTSSQTIAVTIPSSCANPYMFVGATITSGSLFTVSGITYNGVSLSQVASSAVTLITVDSEFWVLANPTHDASSHNVVITASGSSTAIQGFVWTFCNAAGVDVAGTDSGVAATPSKALTATTGTYSIDTWVTSDYPTTATPNSPQVELVLNGNGGYHDASYKSGVTAGSVTTSWTFTGTWTRMAHSVVIVK